MDIKQGTDVVSADGEQVGHIERVVMDPNTKEVTHLVVQKGLLLTEDKVVPVDMVASATEEEVRLRTEAGELQALPDFEETYAVTVEGEEWYSAYPAGYAQPYYWYPPAGPAPAGYAGYPAYPYLLKTKRNIPEGTVTLEEGAKVISAGDKHVGDVERIFTDPASDQATHLLISKGLLFKERKLVPIEWVNSIGEDEIRLAVGAGFLDRLPDYRE